MIRAGRRSVFPGMSPLAFLTIGPMGQFLRAFLLPFLKPASRLIAGLIAIPAFRLLRRRVVRVQDLDEELEKDIDEWFRGALLLVLSTANFERWVDAWFVEHYSWDINLWWLTGGRILLAIGVIEAMPDQELFSIIHPGPPAPKYDREIGLWGSIKQQARPIIKGLICQYLNRSSPVFAIMATIFTGTTGWVCYWLAILQYLIIGLVTSRDLALDVLSEFDRKVAERRQELIEEFEIDETKTAAPLVPASMAATYSTRMPQAGPSEDPTP